MRTSGCSARLNLPFWRLQLNLALPKDLLVRREISAGVEGEAEGGVDIELGEAIGGLRGLERAHERGAHLHEFFAGGE
jgi:hypothetical protein